MKIKTADATELQLDWLVAKCEGRPELHDFGKIIPWTTKLAPADQRGQRFFPSTNWSQGGPIIERERINIRDEVTQWASWMWDSTKAGDVSYFGPTPLIAAMRCFVASKLGDEVEVPDELA